MKRNTLKEFASNFKMFGTRRYDAPGNIRHGQNVRGVRAPHLEEPFFDAISPRAAVIYVKKNNQVLAVSRGSDLSDMNMPGGGVETGEEPRDAAARELWEETGLIAHELMPIFSKQVGGKIVTAFKAISYSGRLKSSQEGKAEWVDPSEILQSSYGDFFSEMLDSLAGDFLSK